MGKTRQVKVGGGVGLEGVGGCAPRNSRLPSPVNTTRTRPLQRRISGLKDNEWKRCKPETYREEAGTVGRVPDAQMQRGAMPLSCQKLGATFIY